MHEIKYAKPGDYKRAYKELKAIGQSDDVPYGARSEEGILIFRKYSKNPEIMSSTIRHEIGHIQMGHEAGKIHFNDESLTAKFNMASSAKLALQELEAIYWGYYKTGYLDKEQLKFEKDYAKKILGKQMTEDIEKIAIRNVKEKLRIK